MAQKYSTASLQALASHYDGKLAIIRTVRSVTREKLVDVAVQGDSLTAWCQPVLTRGLNQAGEPWKITVHESVPTPTHPLFISVKTPPACAKELFSYLDEQQLIEMVKPKPEVVDQSAIPKKKKVEGYQVYVADNYHYMDGRYAVGSYDTSQEAVEKCQEITIKSLRSLYEAGITPETLSAQWAMFGEDPYIFSGDGSVLFSARKFITIELCQEIINSLDSV